MKLIKKRQYDYKIKKYPIKTSIIINKENINNYKRKYCYIKKNKTSTSFLKNNIFRKI